VRHQHHGARGIDDGLLQPRGPVASQRAHPVVLLHALKAMQRLPAALPMVGAGTLPTRQNEHGIGG